MKGNIGMAAGACNKGVCYLGDVLVLTANNRICRCQYEGREKARAAT